MKKIIAATLLVCIPASSFGGWVSVMEQDGTGAKISIGDKKQVQLGSVVVFWERIKIQNPYIMWDTALLRIIADCDSFESVTLNSSTYTDGKENSRNDSPSGVTVPAEGTPAHEVIKSACGIEEVSPEDVNHLITVTEYH